MPTSTAAGAPMSAATVPMVDAAGVCKSFGALQVLKGVTWRSSPGQVLCLIGPSGSGKSTFLRCINHLEQVNAGRLYVDGDLVGYERTRRQAARAAPARGGQAAPRHRHGVPALQPVPAHDRAGEHHRGADPGQEAQEGRRGGDRARRCWSRSGWPTRPTRTRPSCPAASSSGSRSRGRWRCSPS